MGIRYTESSFVRLNKADISDLSARFTEKGRLIRDDISFFFVRQRLNHLTILNECHDLRFGFGRCLWCMALALNLPDLFYVYLSFHHPGLIPAGICIALEQFGYGLGYTAFMLVMVAAAESSGAYKTSHFAIMTGISILGLCLIGMISGWVQEFLGFAGFFRYVMVCTIPGFLVTIPVSRNIPRDFGRKT